MFYCYNVAKIKPNSIPKTILKFRKIFSFTFILILEKYKDLLANIFFASGLLEVITELLIVSLRPHNILCYLHRPTSPVSFLQYESLLKHLAVDLSLLPGLTSIVCNSLTVPRSCFW